MGGGDETASEVEVHLTTPQGEAQLHRAVSFFTLRGGKIVHLREYWPEPYPAPDWRARWVEVLE